MLSAELAGGGVFRRGVSVMSATGSRTPNPWLAVGFARPLPYREGENAAFVAAPSSPRLRADPIQHVLGLRPLPSSGCRPGTSRTPSVSDTRWGVEHATASSSTERGEAQSSVSATAGNLETAPPLPDGLDEGDDLGRQPGGGARGPWRAGWRARARRWDNPPSGRGTAGGFGFKGRRGSRRGCGYDGEDPRSGGPARP